MEVKKSPKSNLENKKLLFRQFGLIAALGLVLLAFEYSTRDKQVGSMEQDAAAAVEEELIPVTRETPPPPPEVPQEPTVSDVINIVDDDIKIDNELVVSTEDNKNLGVEVKNFVQTNVDEVIEEEEVMAAIVEDKPKFQGGDENTFSTWVNSKIVYPEAAIENGVQGRVMLSFLVGTDGRVTDVQVIRGIHPSLDKEAVRVVSMSPKWEPGRQRDRAVKVRYTFPVVFQLR